MLSEESFHLVERDNIQPIVQISMACAGDNHQFLVVAFQQLVGILAEITGVCLFAMDDEHGVFYLIRTIHQREVDKRNGFRGIPSLVGIERAFVITTRRLVIIVVIFDKLRGICRQYIRYAACRFRRAVTEILRALCSQCLA